MSLIPLLLVLLLSNCDDRFAGFSWLEVREIVGEAPLARLGSAADWIGNLNGDEFADLVVGAPGDSRNGSAAGAVYVYLGSASGLSETPQTLILGKADDRFGSSIAGIGDVNRDGLEDFAVAAAGCVGRGITGRSVVLVFFGRAGGIDAVRDAETAEIVLSSETDNGIPVVSSAGDLDQNGLLDLAVGLPEANRVLIFLGGVTFPGSEWMGFSQADITITGVSAGDRFGSALAAVGDVNGRNLGLQERFGDDLLIGASGAGEAGRAYLFTGRSGRARGTVSASTADAVYDGMEAGEGFGSSVAGLGDFDGDGIADFAVGSPDEGAGAVSVFFGRSNSGPDPALPPARFTGEAEGDRFGTSIAGTLAGPIAGETALLVGAPGNDFVGSNQGAAYLFSRRLFASGTTLNGASAAASFADRILRNPQAGGGIGGEFGAVVRMGLDLNGDTNPDLLIGLPGSDLVGEDSGMAVGLW